LSGLIAVKLLPRQSTWGFWRTWRRSSLLFPYPLKTADEMRELTTQSDIGDLHPGRRAFAVCHNLSGAVLAASVLERD